MDATKTVAVCPVCGSTDVVQEVEDDGDFGVGRMIRRVGSHCGCCGVRFAFNAPCLKKEGDTVSLKAETLYCGNCGQRLNACQCDHQTTKIERLEVR